MHPKAIFVNTSIAKELVFTGIKQALLLLMLK